MGDVDYGQPQDDFEIEISSLDELDTAGDTAIKAADSSRSSYSLLQPRFSSRQRKLQLLITAGIILLTLLVILGSNASVRNLVTTAITDPTSTPGASGIATDLFYIQGSPPWGHLSVDGHAVSHLPVAGNDFPLRLSPGRHVLYLRADPFLPQSCTMTVPADFAKDTCIYDQAAQVEPGLYASIILFSESLKVLPAMQRTALIQATQATLDTMQSSQIVQPGEFYAVASEHRSCKLAAQVVLCFAAAKYPLRATLRFQLDTGTSLNTPCASGECIINGHDCRSFCDASVLLGPAQALSSATKGWNVIVVVRTAWQYATLDGRIIAQDQADTFIDGMENQEHLMPVSITWNSSGWHVSLLPQRSQGFFSNPVCDSAQGDAGNLINNIILNSVQINLQEQFAVGTDPTVGCLEVITPQDQLGSPPIIAYCLHRFGVLLAANDVAHRYWPYLPVADTYEQQLAQRIAAEV